MDWCTPLHLACRKGHLDVVRVLASKFQADLTARNYKGRTPLHHACLFGQLAVANTLISDFKVDCTERDNDGSTALHFACRQGHLDMVRMLMSEFNSSQFVQDNDGKTPLHCACEKGHLMIAKELASIADHTMEDNSGDTPLHYASRNGHLDVVRTLASLIKTDISRLNVHGRTPLHCASEKGHFEVVRELASQFKADCTAKDWAGQTPLHCAVTGDVVRVLVSEFNADPSARDSAGRTPLHCASERNHLEAAKVLVSEIKADHTIKDNQGCTPLHLACKKGNESILELLVYKLMDTQDTTDSAGHSLLHSACKNGHYCMASVLISEFKIDCTIKDCYGLTPLHYACRGGHFEIAEMLLCKNADHTIQDNRGCTALHCACREGHLRIVRLLLSKNADHTLQDSCGNTPLHYASENGHVSVVIVLVSQFKADHSRLNIHGHSPLHCASRNGHVEVVESLLYQLTADHTLADASGRTALHLASEQGHWNVVRVLGARSPSIVDVQDKSGRTPLLCASERGNGEVVEVLVRRYKPDVTLKDNSGHTIDPNFIVNQSGETLLHVASASGDCSLVLALVKMGANVNSLARNNRTPLTAALKSDFFSSPHFEVASILLDNGCNFSSVRGFSKRSPLHIAAVCGHNDVLNKLLKFLSPLLTDNFGNTPLHLASSRDRIECVKSLVHSKAPLFARNKRGETPVDVAMFDSRAFFTSYITENRKVIACGYDEALKLARKKYSGSKLARKKYSGSNHVTRVFVLGNPGAGKSTFVESLKREGFFQSLLKVTVPPHTAGIIPSVFVSEQYGRVMFYDFAGDAEYYSSHAAIFECLASSKKGSNLFIIVVDLSQDNATIKTTLYYWFSFIQYERYTKPLLIVVGSHSDLSKNSSEKAQLLDEFCASIHEYTADTKSFLLDCRDARSSQISQFRKQILKWASDSPKHKISYEASILLGLLEKDFREVAACPVQTLVSHVKESGVWLPESLDEVLLELHEVGLVLLLGDCTKSSDHVILDIPKLTNEVHELLFSERAASKLRKSQKIVPFNVGILPEAFLAEILPPYITKECLIYLQYCQEISQSSVSMFPALEHITSEGLLYFPALCTLDKSQVSWDVSSSSEFCIGWLALCSDPHDYFPKRFHHVLLLRLVYGFTRSVPEELQTAHTSPVYSRHCTMWKSGVQWSTVKGVKCMVELVNESKGIVVLSRSSKGRAQDCVDTFLDVVNCVLQAKVEFCQTIHPQYFFLDSVDEADYLNKDHYFLVSEVEEDLAKGSAVSISLGSGASMLDLSPLQCLRRRTQWNTLFPISSEEVLLKLRIVVSKIFDLALCIGAPYEFIETLQALPEKCSSDIDRRRMEVVNWWMNDSLDPPCWRTLVEALKDSEMKVLAEEIRQEHNVDVELQEKMLDEENKDKKPDEKFLRSLSGVVGSRWPSVAVTLSLSSDDIEGLNEKAGLHQLGLAFQMLKTWSLKEDATYDQLCCKLRAISIFQHSK